MNCYKKYKILILIPAFLVLALTFFNIAGVNSVLAKKSFKTFHLPKFDKVLSYFTHHDNKNENDHDESDDNEEKRNEDKHEEHEISKDGHIDCGFDGSAIFNVTNMLPGDSEVKVVTVENNSNVPVIASLKGARTGPAGQTDPLFETTLDFSILHNANMIYSNKLANYFSETDGVNLGIINPATVTTFNLKVDFPNALDNNDFQNKSVVFDLMCGRLAADHIVINEVYYNVDSAHGLDSWKDRGSPKKDGKKGIDDEWIELYNPTASAISLKNWTLEDNSGKKFVIHSNSIIKAGGFALISKDQSMWKYWKENSGAVKISSDGFLGDGLDNAGDHLILKNALGTEIDFVRWGSDNTSGHYWSEDLTDPFSVNGASIERLVPGFDNDLSSDWLTDINHTPTP